MKKSNKKLFKVRVGVSNSHVHLTKEHFEELFGYSEPTPYKWLKQRGLFSCEEVVIVQNPKYDKGELPGVRVVGPFRKETQVELIKTHTDFLELSPPMRRLSGDITGSPGVVLVGTVGTVRLKRGATIAWPHIHMSEKEAEVKNIADGADVKVWFNRGCLIAKIRTHPTFSSELHIDYDEANVFDVRNGDTVMVEEI